MLLCFSVITKKLLGIRSNKHSKTPTVPINAKYVKAHADEIVLEAIPKDMRSGRLYKRYRK
jgi:hypothetical protein